MIKVYSDTSFITPKFRRMIFPLLFDLCYTNNINLLKKYQLVELIEDADIVIVPVDVGYFFKENKTQWLYNFIEEGNNKNKKVWVYSAGDIGVTMYADVFTFRLGGFDSKLNDKTFIMPSFINNPFNEIKSAFKPIDKTELPYIGFMGHANGSSLKYAKEVLIYIYHNLKRITHQIHDDYQPFYPSSCKRYNYLIALQNNNRVKTDFICRKKYRAGIKTDQERKQTTLDFFENIYNNPYTFCLRGAGNFSVRLYETLAMGRIPVIIDTDMRLPLGNYIDWEKHCIIATENDFIEKLIDFHNAISENDFIQIQINNRNLWSNHLNRNGFFNIIHTIFKEM